ncbi:cinnamoyl-CoA reductase 1-like [Impatiens glandulifera]|uniref:cinnamoyl-CoA reductase 1-like n=1 Tax=Impatiens glandulifera TaxID=253017 RepID=UPI001FB0AA3C|nr:cinnamoyl-CoA reductase 1-like [Impatiens glandulifera]
MTKSIAKGSVCVTGAGGYVASWLIKLLLSNGYTVHGTVRDPPQDEKYLHLRNLENAEEKLKLFKAHLFDYDSMVAAISGCKGVFHVASPVPSGSVQNPEVELVETAVKGTQNVLMAALEANVNRVVFVSSVAAVQVNPAMSKDQLVDETCWSDKDFCRNTNNWYCLSKTEAEMKAMEFAKRSKGLDLVTLCPGLVFGPKLQPSINNSSWFLINFIKGMMQEETDNLFRMIVDVRDVARALLLVYEKPESEGRYICSAHSIRPKGLAEMLKKIYPSAKYFNNFNEENRDQRKISSDKLQKLGWTFMPLEQTLADSVENYKRAGLLD